MRFSLIAKDLGAVLIVVVSIRNLELEVGAGVWEGQKLAAGWAIALSIFFSLRFILHTLFYHGVQIGC
jgi:hypothetical protein